MEVKLKYYVDRYWADCEEDSYDNGIIGSGSRWTDSECPADGSYDSIREAIAAVCIANSFTFRTEGWEHDPCGNSICRFYTDLEVTNDNSEADEHDLEEWRNGRKRLWCCHLAVFVRKRYEISEDDSTITEEEAASWMK